LLVPASNSIVFLIHYNNYKYKLAFCDVGEAKLSVKFLDRISVL
jgi:hypothetical protein